MYVVGVVVDSRRNLCFVFGAPSFKAYILVYCEYCFLTVPQPVVLSVVHNQNLAVPYSVRDALQRAKRL